MDKLLIQLEQINQKLKDIPNDGDTEINHQNADEFLMLTIRAIIGSTNDPQHKALFEEIIVNYEAVDKWYA